MVRIITRVTDTADACNVGGPVHVRHYTWEIRDEALEQHLRMKSNKGYITVDVVGAEVVND